MSKKRDQSKTMEISFSDLQVLCVPRPTAEREDQLFDKDSVSAPPIPKTVIDGRYEVVERLGAGAMGSVFLVRHVRLGKQFALKTVNPNLAKMPEFVTRFEREADACSRLTHPNCISVTDFGQASDGTLYLVMEYADGVPLSDLLEEGPVPVPEAIEYARQILLGLKHAHEGGLIHRDIKLENVIKCQGDGGQINLKILDFGMAKERPGDAGSPQLTRDGLIMGTPHYMAPEQVGEGQVDARVDLYAVGVTLFRLITGEPVFEGSTVIDVFSAKLKYRAPTLGAVTGIPYPEPLEEFVAKALERNPDDRYSNAGEMLEALEEAAMHVPGMPGVMDWTSSFIRAEHIEALHSDPLPPSEIPVDEPPTDEPPTVVEKTTFRGQMRGELTSWYHCLEQEEAPGWPLRIKGLVLTPSGRIVLVRGIAVLLVLGALLSMFLSAPPENPNVELAPAETDKGQREEAPVHRLSSAPKEQPPAPRPAKDEEEIEEEAVHPMLMEAALLIEEKKCSKAKRVLAQAKGEKGARVFYLKGRIHMCLSQGALALKFYRKAVAADPAYRTDSRLLEDAKKLVSAGKLRLSALNFMGDLGKPALPTLIHLAESHLSKDVRKRALKLVDKLGATEHVDMSYPLELDLNQARSCNEKRAVVKKLAKLNTKRARQVLLRARDAQVKDGWFKKKYKNECIRPDIILALKAMRKNK